MQSPGSTPLTRQPPRTRRMHKCNCIRVFLDSVRVIERTVCDIHRKAYSGSSPEAFPGLTIRKQSREIRLVIKNEMRKVNTPPRTGKKTRIAANEQH
uniref:Transposase n=1 Tax=Panagrellus redivivus TaxID=6233 RepID=A0A7E4VI55_PANRE